MTEPQTRPDRAAGPSPALVLLRHAAPEPQAHVPPPQWRLSAEGRAAAQRLAERLSGIVPAEVWASSEPKAIETAEILARRFGLPVACDPAFDEQRRAAWPYEPDPEAVRRRVLQVLSAPFARVEGAETGAAAAARFAEGLARHPRRPLIVVSHGAVLSLWLARTLGVEAAALWPTLQLPEALLVSADGGLIGRVA